jgi:uncharacterized membrane protein YkvA (DUF1232 family)
MDRSRHPLRGATRLAEPGTFDRLRLAWSLVRDPRVTSLKYLVPTLLVLYIASPIDPLPDFLLGLGQLDDVGVAIAGILAFAALMPRLAPDRVVAEHKRKLGWIDETAPDSSEPIDARFTVHGATR